MSQKVILQDKLTNVIKSSEIFNKLWHNLNTKYDGIEIYENLKNFIDPNFESKLHYKYPNTIKNLLKMEWLAEDIDRVVGELTIVFDNESLPEIKIGNWAIWIQWMRYSSKPNKNTADIAWRINKIINQYPVKENTGNKKEDWWIDIKIAVNNLFSCVNGIGLWWSLEKDNTSKVMKHVWVGKYWSIIISPRDWDDFHRSSTFTTNKHYSSTNHFCEANVLVPVFAWF